MSFRPWNRVKFEIERLILRSPFHRLAVIAMSVAAISVIGGYLAFFYGRGFSHLPDAIWWAFLRQTDPGYLGDDQGTLLRTISTILTLLGYVLFLGALIAIMTQGLNQSIRQLQRGLTPIAETNHFLILGWTNRTATLIEELIVSEGRVRRFLRRRGARQLRIVVLVEDLDGEIVQDLRDRLGKLWNSRQIVVRSGTPLRLEHLERVDFLNAAAILLPLPRVEGQNLFAGDERTIKILLSITSSARQKKAKQVPIMVAELLDGRKVSVAQRAYDGPIEILASDLLISRLIAQNVRHAGLSAVYSELLTHSAGSEIYVRRWPHLAGRRFGELAGAFPRAILLGVVRPRGDDLEPFLLPGPELEIEEDDRFVLVARSYEAAAPERVWKEWSIPVAPTMPLPRKTQRRILILGWNHKVPALVAEFSGYASEVFEMDVVSLVPASEREIRLHRHGMDHATIRLRQIEADFTSQSELAALGPERYDNIVVLASDWLETEFESDARTILGFLLVDEILSAADKRPEVLVELMDAENVPLLRGRADVLISPLVLAHMVSQVALRRELRAVFEEMFGPTGVEIFLRPAHEIVKADEKLSWGDLSHRVQAHGEIALGVRKSGEAPLINPRRDSMWLLSERDELVVLTR